MFIREIVRKIELAHKHKQAISVAIYPHSADGNKQPKLDEEIGQFGSCHHLNFHKAHKIIDMKPLTEFKEKNNEVN